MYSWLRRKRCGFFSQKPHDSLCLRNGIRARRGDHKHVGRQLDAVFPERVGREGVEHRHGMLADNILESFLDTIIACQRISAPGIGRKHVDILPCLGAFSLRDNSVERWVFSDAGIQRTPLHPNFDERCGQTGRSPKLACQGEGERGLAHTTAVIRNKHNAQSSSRPAICCRIRSRHRDRLLPGPGKHTGHW